jgi:hypothetical protein
MDRCRTLFKKLAIVFGIIASLILLPFLFLCCRLGGPSYPSAETLRNFSSIWRWGFVCLLFFVVCFIFGWWDPLKRLKPVLKKTIIGVGVLLAVFAAFILEENIRGKIALRSYIRELRSKGERLTLAEINLPKPPKDRNSIAALVALTNQFAALRSDCPFEPFFIISRVHLVGLGRAVVRCEQPDLGVNFNRHSSAQSGRGGPRGRQTDEREPTTNGISYLVADWTDLDEQVVKASNVLEEIKQAAGQSALSAEIDYSQGFDVRVPHLQPIRNATTWLGLAAMGDLHHRNFEAATQNIRAIAGLSQFGRDERLLVSQVHRWQIGLTGLNLTWEALQQSGWTDDQLFALEQAWRESSVSENTPSILEINRLFYRSGFEHARRLPGWGALHDYIFGCWQGETWPSDVSEFFAYFRDSLHAFTWRLAWLDQDELRFLRLYQLMLDHARNAIERRDWSSFGLSDKDFPYDRKRFLLSDAYTPNLELILRRVFEFETQREMTIAAIGIKRHQLHAGKLPSDLTALVPEYLPQLPHDWMNGKPLRYHQNSDGTFTLYSVGVDGRDDGGDPTPIEGKRAYSIWKERDAVWPMPASEEDIAAFNRQTNELLSSGGRRGLGSVH